MTLPGELEEIRISIERIRTLLENLVVRGLRACGPEELAQLGSFAQHLEETGASHLATALAELKRAIEHDDPASPRTLLQTQINVRLLERLLTLRVLKAQYAAAVNAAVPADGACEDDADDDE